jgi:diguanylate cyclase (GGDEF)-like protein
LPSVHCDNPPQGRSTRSDGRQERRAVRCGKLILLPSAIRAGFAPLKQKSAISQRKTTVFAPPRPKRLRGQSRKQAATQEPAASKPRSRALAARLAAEVERLAAELELSRARIAELEARVDVDPLTETLNRRGFERELTRSLAYVKRYAVSAALVYIDLDEFKPVNDRHGHAAGDAVLKAIAAALIRHVRASDVVARIGGDEFVALLWNVGGRDAATKAAELEAAVYATPVRWAVRRWSSARPPAWRSSARSIRPPRCSPAGTRPCMRARPSAKMALREARLRRARK